MLTVVGKGTIDWLATGVPAGGAGGQGSARDLGRRSTTLENKQAEAYAPPTRSHVLRQICLTKTALCFDQSMLLNTISSSELELDSESLLDIFGQTQQNLLQPNELLR